MLIPLAVVTQIRRGEFIAVALLSSVDASLNSCGTASSRQMSENRCSNLCTSGIPPHFNNSGGMQSAPGALPFVSDFIAQ